jgi:hypothetical protein
VEVAAQRLQDKQHQSGIEITEFFFAIVVIVGIASVFACVAMGWL